MIRKNFKALTTTFSILVAVMFASCTDEGGGPKIDDDDDDPEWIKPDLGFTYDYKTFIGDIDSELKESMMELITNVSGGIDEDTKLIVLGNLGEIDSETLKEAYDRGTTIAIAFPKQAQINSYLEAQSWERTLSHPEMDAAILFSFDSDHNNFILHGTPIQGYEVIEDEDYAGEDPDDLLDPKLLEGEEDVSMPESQHGQYYYRLGSWLEDLIERENQKSLDSDGEESFFAKEESFTESFRIELQEKLRHLASSEPDYLYGLADLKVKYTYRLIHVYQGETGWGDYYIMGMDATMANKDMYYELSNKHGGVKTKICGWICKEFNVTGRLCEYSDQAKEYLPINVSFVGKPLPEGTSHDGSTKTSTSLSLEGSLSIGGGVNKKGASLEGKGEVKAGFTWSKEESFEIGELTVKYLGNEPLVGWGLQYANFPSYSVTGKLNVPESNVSYKSSAVASGRWIWKEDKTPDNVIHDPYFIETIIDAEYFALSHVWSTTKKKTVKISKRQQTQMEKAPNTQTVGMIEIINDFNDKYIYDIDIYNQETDEKYYTDISSHKPGEKIPLGAYYDKGKYMVTFKARVPGDNVVENYIYNLHEIIPMKKSQTTTLNASFDFGLVK